jgi:hypothetical protein
MESAPEKRKRTRRAHVFAINPHLDERVTPGPAKPDLLEETVENTAAVAAAGEYAEAIIEENGTSAVSLAIASERFNRMSRVQAIEAGAWNASYLLNKLRDLSPEGVEALGHYFTETGSELRSRAFRLKAERLQAQTQAWRDAGFPALTAPTHRETPVSSERKAESALNRLKLLISRSEEGPSGPSGPSAPGEAE